MTNGSVTITVSPAAVAALSSALGRCLNEIVISVGRQPLQTILDGVVRDMDSYTGPVGELETALAQIRSVFSVFD